MADRTTDTHRHHAVRDMHSTSRKHGGTTREATRATTAGTRRVAERTDGERLDFRRTLPRRLTVSSLGIGTYLGECTDEDDAAYERTIRLAIRDGVNLIDTASNYRCQRSERVVGRVVEELIASGEGRRDELVV